MSDNLVGRAAGRAHPEVAISSPTKGDLIATDGTSFSKLPVGADGQILTADSAESTGLKWAGGTSSVTTTDATATTLSTRALADDTTYLMTARVVGRDQAGTKRASYIRTALVYRQSAGGAVLGSAGVQSDFTDETTIAWNATIVVSGNNAIVQVTGEAATTIDWIASITLTAVSDGSLDQVQTTNATPTTLSTIVLADDTTYVIEARIVARDTGGTKRASYVRTVMAHRQSAGSATLGGAGIEADFTDETTAAWDATFVVSGNNVLVQVTGEAATTIDWAADVVSTSVS